MFYANKKHHTQQFTYCLICPEITRKPFFDDFRENRRQFSQMRKILETKFGDDPLATPQKLLRRPL